jgi:hypothetical protein
MKKIIVTFFSVALLAPLFVSAKIGVGVGTGKIIVDQPMNAGSIYTLPSLVVLNTGDEPSEYGVAVQFRENQPEMRPLKEWFSFEPSNFHLEPGQSQVVQIKLALPVSGVKPGDYFAFLQGYPVMKQSFGGTSIGVAAAAKLYFTIAPSNIFQGLYYRFISLYRRYHPWDTIILAMVFIIALILFFKKCFKIQIARK